MAKTKNWGSIYKWDTLPVFWTKWSRVTCGWHYGICWGSPESLWWHGSWSMAGLVLGPAPWGQVQHLITCTFSSHFPIESVSTVSEWVKSHSHSNLNHCYPIKRFMSPLSPSAPSYKVISSSTTMSARLVWIRLSICCRHKHEDSWANLPFSYLYVPFPAHSVKPVFNLCTRPTTTAGGLDWCAFSPQLDLQMLCMCPDWLNVPAFHCCLFSLPSKAGFLLIWTN